jgi:hypothetical protein
MTTIIVIDTTVNHPHTIATGPPVPNPYENNKINVKMHPDPEKLYENAMKPSRPTRKLLLYPKSPRRFSASSSVKRLTRERFEPCDPWLCPDRCDRADTCDALSRNESDLIKPRDELAELPGVDAPRSLNNESLLDSSGSRSLLLILDCWPVVDTDCGETV